MAADGRFWRPVQFDNDGYENPVCGLEASAGRITQENVNKKCASSTRLHGNINITEDVSSTTRGENSGNTYLTQQELRSVSSSNPSDKRRHKSDGAFLKKRRCRDTLQDTSQDIITSRKTGHQNNNFFSGAAIQERKLSSVTSQNMSGGDGRTYCDEKGGDCHGLKDVDACTAATDCHRVQDLSSSAVSQGITRCHGRNSNSRDSHVRDCNGGDSHVRYCQGGWLLANYTVVPYVVRDGHQHLSVSVLQYGAGLVDKSLAPYCLQASKAESSFLNQLCQDAGIKFTLNSDTRLISLYVLVQIHPVIAQCVYTIPDNTIHSLLQNLKSIRPF